MATRLSITSTFEIAAEHHLPYHRGKCQRVHGHNYRLEFSRYGSPKPLQADTLPLVEAVGAVLYQDSDTGMIMDFADFDAPIKALLDRCLDHYSLNDVLPNPTAELLALWLLEQLPLVDRVVVWETGRHCVTAEREQAPVRAQPRQRKRNGYEASEALT